MKGGCAVGVGRVCVVLQALIGVFLWGGLRVCVGENEGGWLWRKVWGDMA